LVLKQGTVDRIKIYYLKSKETRQKRLDSVEAGAMILNATLGF
jgi:ribosomal protein L19